MKVLVIGDMEGVAGICRWDQVRHGAPGYEEGRRLYTAEINATVRGAFAGGASEVVVMDCHGAGGERSFNSLIPDALDARCEFVVQSRWTEYTAFLEAGCDAALLVGQHAMAGAERGVLSHTVSSTNWHGLAFNGTAVGEVGINAALCGTWGVPVALVSGDDVVCAEARALLGDDLPTLAVKAGLGRFSARHLAPARARERLEAAAAAALGRPGRPYDPGSPCTITVELTTTDQADLYRHRASVEVVGPRTVEATAATWWEAWRAVYLTKG